MTEPINLKELVGNTYKVQDDGTHDSHREERVWCQEIPGKYGKIYPKNDHELCVSVISRDIIKKLSRTPGLVFVQGGYPGFDEATLSFPPDLIHEVASIIKARKRRILSQGEKDRLSAVLAKVRLAKSNSKVFSVQKKGGLGPQDQFLGD